MKVTYIHSTDPVDEMRVRVRCRNFADAINRVGWHSANLLDLESFFQRTADAEKVCSDSDLLVIHRYLYEPVFQSIQYWKARDKKVVVDFDHGIEDFTSDVSASIRLREMLMLDCNGIRSRVTSGGAMPSPMEQFRWGLGMMDAAIVSSARLVTDWSSCVDVHEIPDYINSDQYPGFKQAHEKEIWIGLSESTGNASIQNSGLLTALESVLQKRPNVKFVYCDTGKTTPTFERVQKKQLEQYQPYSFDEWSDILLRLDIGLLPICEDRDLVAGKVDLIEFMVSKIPWLATDEPNLRELSRYGRLVLNTPDDWESSILQAVDEIDAMQKWAAGEPFLFALSQDVNGNIDKVLKLFTYILDRSKQTGAT